jgi:hypothetical protein
VIKNKIERKREKYAAQWEASKIISIETNSEVMK